MTQPTLFDTPTSRPKPVTLQERFEAWVRHNPEIIELFLRYARDARAAGRIRYGIGSIAERVRWHVNVESRGDDFKINNSYRSRLARLLVTRDTTLAGMFEFRTLKSK